MLRRILFRKPVLAGLLICALLSLYPAETVLAQAAQASIDSTGASSGFNWIPGIQVGDTENY